MTYCRKHSLIIISMISFVAALATNAPAQNAQPPKVLTAAVAQRDISEGHTFVGTVKPLRKSLVGSATAGRVEEFLVNEGDRVQKGQPIAKLRIGVIQAEVNAAKGNLKVRQAELEELKNGSRPAEIVQARARLQVEQAMLEYRRANHDRMLRLAEIATREEIEESLAFASQAEGLLEEAKATLALLEEGPRVEKIAQAQAQVEAHQAEVERVSEQLDRHTMYAPFTGYVTAEHTEIGQWVMQGDPIAEIVELQQVDVEFNVLEDYIAHLRKGTEARVEIGALPNESFTGTVAIINSQADVRARTFPVKVRLENRETDDGPLLKAGMFARVTLAVGKPTTGLLVPKDAVVLGGPAPVVFVVERAGDKQTVRSVNVVLGVSQDDWIEVRGELSAGQQVVVEGNERLRTGQEVRAEPITQ